MTFARKIVVAINLSEPHLEILNTIKEMDFLNSSEVHFTTINQTTTYAIGLGESAIMYPMEEDRRKIREQSLMELNKLGRELIPKSFKGRLVSECLFSDDPKRKFTEYVADNHIDLVILAAREKRGVFESSFSHYVAKHSSANLLILKTLR
jgi:nucleotide-binding universal stress UspA family protein